ncbi:MAG TPA: SPASM domain-containing protein [Micropepsaceae bacterium]|nr:SPASM domain-containing protein [Micropepsaceae bacterium]
MEALYWVLTWACHRRCDHCYDTRFRPYVRDELKAVVGEGQAAFREIIANLPADMTYEVTGRLDAAGRPLRRRTLLVMAGGELLIDGVREELFYPALDALRERYGRGLPNISVQTTGDIMTGRHIEEMVSRGVRTIAIASIDDYHAGMQGDRKFAFMEKIRAMMARAGAREIGLGGARDKRLSESTHRPADDDPGPFFLFFGAQPELWIGELWPRGRAWANGLSNASYETNFCARWSGGKNFLNYGRQGSEIAIEPDGAIYPCCLKTKAPLGNLTEEKLTDILDSLKGHPAFEAINAGDPEAMGLEMGWTREDYRNASTTTDPKGRAFANVCIGCDVFFKEKLSAEITRIRNARLARQSVTPCPAG